MGILGRVSIRGIMMILSVEIMVMKSFNGGGLCGKISITLLA
jgi:hypothetical protein